MSFDAFVRALPGVVGRGLEGKNLGDQQRFRNQILQDESDQRARRLALEESLMQFRMRPPPEVWEKIGVDPVTGEIVQQSSATGQTRTMRGVLDRLREPKEPKAPRYAYMTAPGANGRPVRVQINEETGELRELGEEYRAPQSTGGQKGDDLKPLPIAVSTSLSNLTSLVRLAEEGLGAIQGTKKNVTGPLIGRAGGAMQAMGLMSKEAISAQSKLANLASSIMKERSGGAITPQEFIRLEPFLNFVNVDEDAALQKLTDLANELRAIQQDRLRAYEGTHDVSQWQQAGGPAAPGAPVKRGGRAAGPPMVNSETMDPADYFWSLIDAGLSEEDAKRQTELKYGPPPE